MITKPRLAKRVVLFGVDGAGTFFDQASTPNIDRIFQNGAVCRRTVTEFPSISAECWGAMLHGVDCRHHKLSNGTAAMFTYPTDSPYPSVFRLVRENYPNAVLASFCDWAPINIGIIEDGIGVHKDSAKAAMLPDLSIPYINENDFDLLFYQFDDVDDAGHKNGYGTPNHLAEIEIVDSYIGRIYDAVVSRWGKEDTVFMLEADHGGTPPDENNRGKHGGNSNAEMYVRFNAVGRCINNTELKGMEVRDTASAILHIFGIEQPESWNGKIPDNMFPETSVMERPEGLPLPVSDMAHDSFPDTGDFTEKFADLNPLLYLSFENETMVPYEQFGKLYTVDGIHGTGMKFDDGYMAVDAPEIPASFTVCGWIRYDSLLGQSTIIANRTSNWYRYNNFEKHANDPGFCIVSGGNSMHLMLKTTGSNVDMTYPIPSNAEGGWLQFTAVVDSSKKRAGLSLGFAPFKWVPLPEGATVCPNFGKLYVGMDYKPEGEESHSTPLVATLDDIAVFGSADETILTRLKKYYN